ncbi:MAG TPA: MBL fold metallo-hydrolase [Spirochaetota bacterium]|nr:MBL fold metallo-hydrolase [Spirochaetota bacterium]
MKLIFNGAAKTVTGSCYFLETENSKILIDCGMFQGEKELRERNYLDFNFKPEEIESVLITHAHIDHTGLLPKLVKKGFCGTIYTTFETKELLRVMLLDSAHIQNMETEWENKKRERKGLPKIEPLYTEEDVDKTLKLIKGVEYHKDFFPVKDIKVKYMNAGHILGSAFLELNVTENNITKKIIFSGDVGRSNQAIIQNPEVLENADIVIIEATYGNREHKKDEDTEKEIFEMLNEVIKSNGTLIIPAFAVGRTQEMIYRLFEIFENYNLPEIDVFIDSPMAKEITEIYKKMTDSYDIKTREYIKRGISPLERRNFKFIETLEQSKSLNNNNGPKVIISASGMCDSGRVLHHLKHHIWRENSYILFVGYQAKGTLGRRIIEGAKIVNILGDSVKVNAKVFTIGGLSAHADVKELLAWLRFYISSKPQIFIVHSEEEVAESFSFIIEEKFNLKPIIPDIGDEINIQFKDKELEVSFNKNIAQLNLNEQKEIFEKNISKIKEYLNENEGYNKKSFLNMFLKRLNKNIEELLEEFKVELEK